MQAILFAMLVAGSVALFGTSNVSAAAVNGSAIDDAATALDIVGEVQHWRYGSDFHSRRRSHFRRGSVGPVCPTVCRHRAFTSTRVCVQRC
jgi:hypothetical protein